MVIVLTLLAASPLILTIALLLWVKAGWVAPLGGLASSLALSLFVFDSNFGELSEALGGNARTIFEVLAIIAGGVLLSRIMDATGGQATLARWLSANTGTMMATTFLMTHGAIPFIETVTGFGVSVLIGVPLLINLGFAPLRAALLSVLGLVISAWGSMAPGTLLASELVNVPLTDLGVATAQANWIAPVISGLLIPFIALDAASFKERIKQLSVGVAMGLTLSGFVLISNILLGTPVAGALGSLLNILLMLVFLRIRRKSSPPTVLGVGRSFAPYVVLIGGLIGSQFIFEPLASPAIWLGMASIAAFILLGRQSSLPVPTLAKNAGKLWVSVAIPTGLYMVLGTVFASGGLAEELAKWFATMGTAFLFLSPFLGAVGGYITASTTGANAMFITTQAAGANALGVQALPLLGTHNAAASLWCLASPVRIEAAYQVAAQHGEVDRKKITGVAVGYVFVTTIAWSLWNMLLLG